MEQSKQCCVNNQYAFAPSLYAFKNLSTRKMSECDAMADINRIEILLTIIVGLNGITSSYIQKVVDLVNASSTECGRKKYGLTHNFANSGVARSMNHRLQSLNNKYTNYVERLCHCKDDPGTIDRLSRSMDYTEDCISDALNVLSEYFNKRTSRRFLIVKPEDPVMLSVFLKTITMCDLSIQFFDYITSDKNYYVIKVENHLKKLRMSLLFEQLTKMLNSLDFRDTDGNELDFQVRNTIQSDECSAILHDIISVLFSYEFICGIVEARNEKLNVNSSYKSAVPNFEEKTMTIAQFKEKYRKILNNNK